MLFMKIWQILMESSLHLSTWVFATTVLEIAKIVFITSKMPLNFLSK